jgi:hypothetical protein
MKIESFSLHCEDSEDKESPPSLDKGNEYGHCRLIVIFGDII